MNLLTTHLRQKRIEKGYQQKDIAMFLKIGTSAYSKIENGKTKVTLDMAKAIAGFLKIPIQELIDGSKSYVDVSNVHNSAVNNENSTIILQNEKLTESVLKLAEQVILVLQNQTEVFKEFGKLMRRM